MIVGIEASLGTFFYAWELEGGLKMPAKHFPMQKEVNLQ